MTPLIFYRIAKPAKALHNLPCIDLEKYFPRSNQQAGEEIDMDEQVSLLIKRKQIKWSDVADIELTDESMGAVLRRFQNFTVDQDEQILELIDEKIAS